MRTHIFKLDIQAGGVSSRRVAGWRLATLLFLLHAFAAQSYIAQTHIHDFTQRDMTAYLGAWMNGEHAAPDKMPAVPDEEHCPLCHLVTHTGGMVMPVLALVLTVAFVILPVFYPPERVISLRLPSHSWQSRAPPYRFTST